KRFSDLRSSRARSACHRGRRIGARSSGSPSDLQLPRPTRNGRRAHERPRCGLTRRRSRRKSYPRTPACARPYGLTRRLARKLARVAVGSGPAVEPQLREAPVMGEGSWVGLDVHARSVVAGVIDQGSGEVRSLRLPSGGEAAVAWLQTLRAPVRVVYE